MNTKLYKNDLPEDFIPSSSIAVDTEAMGLNHHRDRLCLVQISNGDGNAVLVKIDKDQEKPQRLMLILEDNNIEKIFHYARFDVGILQHSFKIKVNNVYCTKIASKLVRTYTDYHGLKNLVDELVGVKISKEQRATNWGQDELNKEQIKYASNDVFYLHEIKEKLNEMLKTEERYDLCRKCFDFISTRVELDIMGWIDKDIFSHSS